MLTGVDEGVDEDVDECVVEGVDDGGGEDDPVVEQPMRLDWIEISSYQNVLTSPP